jgi:glycosyltransferase involved in cell wall biosynthesis
MQGGAVSLARQAARMVAEMDQRPDLFLASDMLNLPIFLTLAGAWAADTPVAVYFHENQLTYPLQAGEKRDLHYGFVNFVSALGADRVFFNSAYHLQAFLDELPRLLKHFPDHNELGTLGEIQAKAQVLPLGLDLARLDAHRPKQATTGRPLILWNHRWEYDKDPESFFQAVYVLEAEGIDFGLVLLGESFRKQPDEFLQARQRLPDRIVHFGYAEDASAYAQLLWQADIVVSTALHEFFGAAVVEACYCGCFPILPNRLSYPELIPEACHNDCLYGDLGGLLDRLRQALLHAGEIRAFSLQAHMAPFDWTVMAPRYDQLLESSTNATSR